MSTTWNPSDKDTAVTLSRGNTQACQYGAGGSYRSVRSTTSQSSGKWYFEVTMTEDQTWPGIINPGWLIGVDDGSGVTNNYVGSGTHGFGFHAIGQRFYNGTGTSSAWQGCQFGDVIAVAVDVSNQLIWARNNRSANWNAGGTANPATGVGGYSITPAGPYYIMWSGQNGNGFLDAACLNTGDKTFIIGAPSGFTAWDTGSITRGSGGTNPTTFTSGGNITLSNGNLTATRGAGSGNGNAWLTRGTSYQNSGKVYFEFQMTTIASAGTMRIGLDSRATGGGQPGDGTNGVGFQDNGRTAHHGRDDIPSLWHGAVANAYVGIAVDLDQGLIWARSSAASTNWNNSTSNDPVAGTGGYGISNDGDCYISFGSSQINDAGTLNAGATSFNMTVPTGFVAWDSSFAVNATVNLTGQNATTAIGSFTVTASESKAVTGVAATSAVGHLNITSTDTLTHWDSGAKGSTVTLSNINLTAAVSSGTRNSVRSTTKNGRHTGKFYCTFYVDACVSHSWVIGLENGSGSLSSDPASTANGCGYGYYFFTTDQYQYNGGTQIIVGVGISANITLILAVDLTANLIWLNNPGINTLWNIGGNPSAGTGGLDCSAVNDGTEVFLAWAGANGDRVTMYPSLDQSSLSQLSGFVPWDQITTFSPRKHINMRRSLSIR